MPMLTMMNAKIEVTAEHTDWLSPS